MKNTGLNTILNWALIVGAVALLFSGIKFYNQTKTARSYRAVLNEVNRFQTANTLVGSLVRETVEYSKTHPDIKPILDSILAKQEQINTPVAPAKPATK